jgi:hypothetical protein
MKTFIYPELEMPFLQGLVAKAERHFLFREFSNSSIMTKQNFEQRYAAMNEKDRNTIMAAVYQQQLAQLRVDRAQIRRIYEEQTNNIRQHMRNIHELMRELK